MDVRGISTLSQLFQHDFWGQDITLIDSHKSYRPITTLTFRLDHSIYGMNAYGYHITNVVIYMMTSIMMYHCILQWMDKQMARLATILFIFHPIHVESVASVVGRADCLCGLFYFASMWCYTHACRQQSWSVSTIVTTGKITFFLLLLLLLFVTCFVCL